MRRPARFCLSGPGTGSASEPEADDPQEQPSERTATGRRTVWVLAALVLVAEEGVAGVSHRKIAVRAGVPLGSMTYHFGGIEQLLREAFSRFADHIVAVFDAHLAAPANRDQAREAVTDLIHALSEGSRRDLVLTQELYTLAARRPAYRDLTHAWMRRSRTHGAHESVPEPADLGAGAACGVRGGVAAGAGADR